MSNKAEKTRRTAAAFLNGLIRNNVPRGEGDWVGHLDDFSRELGRRAQEIKNIHTTRKEREGLPLNAFNNTSRKFNPSKLNLSKFRNTDIAKLQNYAKINQQRVDRKETEDEDAANFARRATMTPILRVFNGEKYKRGTEAIAKKNQEETWLKAYTANGFNPNALSEEDLRKLSNAQRQNLKEEAERLKLVKKVQNQMRKPVPTFFSSFKPSVQTTSLPKFTPKTFSTNASTKQFVSSLHNFANPFGGGNKKNNRKTKKNRKQKNKSRRRYH